MRRPKTNASDFVDSDGNGPLHRAIIRADQRSVKRMLTHKSKLRQTNRHGQDAIELALFLRKNNIFRLLFSRYGTKRASTLLHSAAALDNTWAVRFLLERVKINARDHTGRTALHMAAQENSLRAGLILLNNHIKINARDNVGQIAVTVASGEGNWRFVLMLVRFKAKLDLSDEFGNTALHLASAFGQKKVVEVLIRHGASPDARDNEGATPADIALMNGYPMIYKLLRERESK